MKTNDEKKNEKKKRIKVRHPVFIEFGDKVRFYREKNKMTQEDLAYESGVDRTYLSDVELGKRNISLMNICKLSKALEVSLTILFEEVNSSLVKIKKDE